MTKTDFSIQLFRNELSVLQHVTEVIDDERNRENALTPELAKFAREYEKLLKSTARIYRISDTQAMHLKLREDKIKNLLDNSNQGFLTFGADLLVDREYSVECTRIFQKKISGLNVIKLLSGTNRDRQQVFQRVLEQVFAACDSLSAAANLGKLPGIVKVNQHYIHIKYQLVETVEFEDVKRAVMLILTDITEKRNTEDRVFYLSFHDKLTSVYNRTYVDSIIPQLQLESTLPLSVIMADMNGLKLTNDMFGHKSGDRLLKNVAKVLLSGCRKRDIVARWGGDEFLIILPGANGSVCEKVCERIKLACRVGESDPIQPSVSMGYATIEKLSDDFSSVVSAAENMMYNNKLKEGKAVRRKIILNLEQTLHTKCFEDKDHTRRLIKLVGQFAQALGISVRSQNWNNLMMLASYHDIGKVAIPPEILGKTGTLTQEELQIMRNYTQIGYRMAQSIEEPLLAQAILAVREYYDGHGYPYGLRGEEIPLSCRIFAIIEVYDVMTHDRPYQKKRGPVEAAQEIEKCSASQFDPELVRVFLQNYLNWDTTAKVK